MTARTLTSPVPVPVHFHASSRHAELNVVIGDVERATVTIETRDTTGPAHEAVQGAVLTQDRANLAAHVTDPDTGSINGVVVNGRGGVFIGGSNHGVVSSGNMSVVQSGGRTWINGVEVTNDGTKGSGKPPAPITITAHLPAGSSVHLRTISGDIDQTGMAASAHADSTSGRIRIDAAATVEAESVSGRIEVGRAASVIARSTSGRISIGTVGAVTASTVSGRIEIRDTSGRAVLRTVSGRIEAGYSGPVRPEASSVSGRIEIERVAGTGTAVRDAAPTVNDTPGWQRPEPEDAIPPEYAQSAQRATTPWWRR